MFVNEEKKRREIVSSSYSRDEEEGDSHVGGSLLGRQSRHDLPWAEAPLGRNFRIHSAHTRGAGNNVLGHTYSGVAAHKTG